MILFIKNGPYTSNSICPPRSGAAGCIMAKKWKPPIREVTPARPYVALVFDDPNVYVQARDELIGYFGHLDYETAPISTESLQSPYFPVTRRAVRFVSFERQVGREELVDMRKKTLQIEMRYQHEGRPLVELDPGYVSEFSVVRTALEEDFHRVYLYHGIHAEPLYYFEKLSYRPLIHTPEFFRKKEIVIVFNDLRVIHMAQS